MTGICYITPGRLKIPLAPAKFIRDGPGYCIVTGHLGARTWQPTQTQQLLRHTPTVWNHSSLRLTSLRLFGETETNLYTNALQDACNAQPDAVIHQFWLQVSLCELHLLVAYALAYLLTSNYLTWPSSSFILTLLPCCHFPFTAT